MDKIIIGNSLPYIPWEEKPKNCTDLVWRFSGNPILGWNPIPKAARVYNSAIVPYNEKFAGVFRADQKKMAEQLYLQEQAKTELKLI